MYLPHQQRVVDELVELNERLRKLMVFLRSPLCLNLPANERSLLRSQARFMDGYAAVLIERVEAFKL